MQSQEFAQRLRVADLVAAGARPKPSDPELDEQCSLGSCASTSCRDLLLSYHQITKGEFDVLRDGVCPNRCVTYPVSWIKNKLSGKDCENFEISVDFHTLLFDAPARERKDLRYWPFTLLKALSDMENVVEFVFFAALKGQSTDVVFELVMQDRNTNTYWDLSTDRSYQGKGHSQSDTGSESQMESAPCSGVSFEDDKVEAHKLEADEFVERIVGVVRAARVRGSDIQAAVNGVDCENHTFLLRNDLSYDVVVKTQAPYEVGISMYYPIALIKGLMRKAQSPEWVVFYQYSHNGALRYMFAALKGNAAFYANLSTDKPWEALYEDGIFDPDQYFNSLPV